MSIRLLSPKSSLKSGRQSRGKVPEVWWERLVKKIGFEPRVKKRRS